MESVLRGRYPIPRDLSQMIKKFVNMPKGILIFLVLCLGIQTLRAQDLVDCTYLLEDAREAYEAGMGS